MHDRKSAAGSIGKVVILTGLLAATLGIASCSKKAGVSSGQMETIRFGDLKVESSAFIYIAEEEDLFAQNGLNVTIETFDTGPNAIKAMMNNEVEMATTGEFAFVTSVLAKDNLSVLGSMDKYQAFYLVGRKDFGIEKAADLKGRKIGVVLQALPEFYLGRFLELEGLSIQDVKVVDVKPASWVEAISNGEVEAIVVSRSFVSQIQARLQDRMVAWPVQNEQDAFALIESRMEWVRAHPELVQRFLTSLKQAEDYSILHPAAAQAIVQKQLGLDEEALASVWPQHQFNLTLDESLVAAMEDETRWMIMNNLTAEKQVPNFLDYIHENSLKAIKPQAVNIIR